MEFMILYDIFSTVKKEDDISKILKKIDNSPIEVEKKIVLYDIIRSISSQSLRRKSSKL